MLVIKATKDTLKDLNVQPSVIENIDTFYSWHVNFFTLYRKKHYVFMNDLSRLSLTVTGIRKNQSTKLKEIFIANLKDYLLSEELSEDSIDSYLNKCNEVTITKTDSKSVLSTLNEVMFMLKAGEDTDKFRNLNELNQLNNTIFFKPINYNKPIDVFNKELERRIHI